MVNDLKPSFRQLTWSPNSSFNVKVDLRENLRNSYHYHPEMELILLKRSTGIRIIGSSVDKFFHNELILIGKNLPHAFLHEEAFLEKNGSRPPEAIVIQFNETFLGNEFLDLPELKEIKHLFRLAKQGLMITDHGKRKVIPMIEKMLHVSSLDRILLLLEILSVLINREAYKALTDDNAFQMMEVEVDKRISKVLEFTIQHYDQNIKIEDVAEMINMTKESFCRYFKAQTHKTYLEFLIELRICNVCRMIIENELSIKEIGYSCGFDSLSNFHYQFKKIIKQSPLEYRDHILGLRPVNPNKE